MHVLDAFLTEAERAAVFDHAVARFHDGDVNAAIDLLRTLALAAPSDRGVWRALAACHATLGQGPIASSLAALGDVLAELSGPGGAS